MLTIIVVDGQKCLAENRKILHRFIDLVVLDVVARSLGAWDQVVAHVLFDEAVAMMRSGSRALRMTTTESAFALLKYGSTKSSRRLAVRPGSGCSAC